MPDVFQAGSESFYNYTTSDVSLKQRLNCTLYLMNTDQESAMRFNQQHERKTSTFSLADSFVNQNSPGTDLALLAQCVTLMKLSMFPSCIIMLPKVI